MVAVAASSQPALDPPERIEKDSEEKNFASKLYYDIIYRPCDSVRKISIF
jgi:hypothetical protein